MPFKKGQIPWNKTNTQSICQFCCKSFPIAPSRLKDQKTKRGLYCSRQCTDNSKIGKPAWNKDKKGLQTANKTSFKKGAVPWNWKNGKAGYIALHQWIRRKLGKPQKCLHCDNKDKLVWANKSHAYKWEIADWLSLCRKCHGKYDAGKNRGAIKRTFRTNS